MSQEKAQLIAPQGHFTVPGLNVAGVVTASSFSGNCTGTASSITKGSNVVVGVMTASSFAGDVFGNAAGLSTTTAGLKLGIVTATSFAGNFTGIGSGLTGTPNIVAGLVTASQFVGNTPGLAAGISAGKNLAAGIVTATTFYGDGSNLTGAGSTAFIKQDVTAVSGTTTINLNDGNIIYLTHSNNTTIAFSNVKTADDVTIIRTLTDNTITWPAAITWNGGSAPTLLGANSYSLTGQVFNLVTYNGGTNWYGYEEVNSDNPQPFKLFALGRNNVGNLGLSNTTDYSSPVQVGSEATWIRIGSTGMYDSAAVGTGVKSDGTLWTWGQNNYGRLGHNNHTDYSSPRQVPGTTWAFSDMGDASAAVKTDGTLWMWGFNQHGQMGDNSRIAKSSPVQIPGTTWSTDQKSLSCGGSFTAAIKTDGTLWVWGNGASGRLGLNQPHSTRVSSPTQVGSETTWDTIDTGSAQCFATKTDGTLWSWGAASGDGNLGHNDKTNRSSPTQIPGTTWATGYLKVSAHGQGGACIRTDGTLWTWGNNGQGELGLNNKTEYSSPKQVPGTTWRTVQGAQDAMIATKTDGTFWAWGANTYGSLGQNDRTSESSPKQIPGTDWGQIIGVVGGGSLSFFGTQIP